LMAGTLDSLFEAVKGRGEHQSQFFLKYLGGNPEPVPGTVKTGDVELPQVRLAGEVLNGNERLLKAFRDLTGDEAAFLVIKDNKLYRLATLLKDKDGKSMNGVPIGDGDPVAKAVLAGKDYQGLTIRGGKYNFSTVKVFKGADGKAWGAYSVRIGLDADLQRVRAQFGSIVAGKTGYVFIVRPTDEKTIGEFVLHPKFQEKHLSEIDVPPAAKAAVAEVLSRKQGGFRYNLPDADGREREKIVFAATSSAWGWTVATGSWLDEYLEESHALRDLVILVSVLAALILALVIYLLVNARLRGLSHLVAEVARVSAGDLRVSVRDADAGSRNEVHAIAHAFNLMAESIRNLLRGVADTSGQVGLAAGESQVAANAARQGAEQASPSANGIARSVEELDVSNPQVAARPNQARPHPEATRAVSGGPMPSPPCLSGRQSAVRPISTSPCQIAGSRFPSASSRRSTSGPWVPAR